MNDSARSMNRVSSADWRAIIKGYILMMALVYITTGLLFKAWFIPSWIVFAVVGIETLCVSLWARALRGFDVFLRAFAVNTTLFICGNVYVIAQTYIQSKSTFRAQHFEFILETSSITFGIIVAIAVARTVIHSTMSTEIKLGYKFFRDPSL
jgi:hypothetical protein